MKTTIERFKEKYVIDKTTKCWNWVAAKNEKGYGRFAPTHGDTWLAHRFSYFLKFHAIEDKMQIHHLCNNSSCVNPKHLAPGSNAENVKYMMKCKRHLSFTNPKKQSLLSQKTAAKLTVNQVLEIRNRSESSYSMAREYGITYRTLRDIKTHKTWRNI